MGSASGLVRAHLVEDYRALSEERIDSYDLYDSAFVVRFFPLRLALN